MVTKTPLGGGAVQVTFRMPSLEGVTGLHVSGEWNGWSTTAEPLARQADGSWAATLVLEAGRSYRYRYCDDLGTWHNDWQADAYVPNSFGSEDSVVVVPRELEAPPAPAQPADRKHPAKRAASARAPERKPAKRSAAKKPAAKKPAAKRRGAK